ncbi:hypothetical protein IKN40_08795 [bacterium]|nr:hypothetical protein [Clostridia bacterium]MBR4617951.1 hypothetical protein [Bacilli bacterium]MBR6908516.1 hypothetical protein [bacterium]
MEVSEKITPFSNDTISATKKDANLDDLNYFFIAEEKEIFAANPKKPARVRFGAKTKEEAEKYAEMFKSMLPNSYRYDFRIEKVDKEAIKKQQK